MSHTPGSWESRNPAVAAIIAVARRLQARPSRFALDRASIRTTDRDGHLHVGLNPISKANVCGYYGSEIPDAEALGLRPDRLYQLYRDPAELAKAAASFNGKPLQVVHRPQTASDHSRQVVVGAVRDPVWASPYLKAKLVVWDSAAIRGINSGAQRELSCGYRYRAIMTPGEIGGVKFDGRMVDIQGNHVSMCETGRVGSDVIVGDAMPRNGLKRRSVDMADGPKRSEDLDYVEIFGNLVAYLEDLLAPEQLQTVLAIIDGDPAPESEGAMDSVARHRQAGAARRMAERQQDNREIAARFPGYASLKVR